MHRIRRAAPLLFAVFVTPAASLAAQHSDVGITPFVSFLSATGRTPMAGLALTLAGNPGFAIRMSGRTALKNTYAGGFGAGSLIPPWGADADAMIPLSGRPFNSRNRSAATFVFIGIGTAGTDSGATRVATKNWSYGVGTALPLGSVVDIFADSRWRMLRFVLPTASPRPARRKEFRFGLTFHVGGGNIVR